jgi:tetratricopeptide (TPR) repeat protein
MLMLLLLMSLGTASFAQSVRPQLGRLLDEAGDLMEHKHDLAGALEKVKQADALPNKTAHEDYEVAKNLGLIALRQPMPDYAAAAAAYDRQIASGGVDNVEKPAMYRMAATVHLSNKDYARTIKDIDEVKRIQPLVEDDYLIVAMSYWLSMDSAHALETTRAGIAAETAAKHNPDNLRFFLQSLESGARPQIGPPGAK